MNRRQALTGGVSLAATTALWPLAGRGQEVWPSRTIKIICLLYTSPSPRDS